MRLNASLDEWQAMPICFMLLTHCVRAAAARTFCTAGTRSAIKIAMIAITTNSSINVKPAERERDGMEESRIEAPGMRNADSPYDTTQQLIGERQIIRT